MKTEQIARGQLKVGGSRAVLSLVRLTIDSDNTYGEVAYKDGKDPWRVVASHLNDTEAAAVFAALDGAEVDRYWDIKDLVSRTVQRH